MDDILIEIPSLQDKANALKTLADNTYRVAEKMTVILQQLRGVWQDESIEAFEGDAEILIRKILQMQVTTNKMAQICQEACDVYQKADNAILNMI